MAEYNSVNLGRIMPKYTGDYSTNVNYNTLDIVFYEGSSYIATQPSLRQIPAIDSEYWGLISGKGDKGDKGDTGATGQKGDKGEKGDPGKDAEMPVIGGRNYILNSSGISASNTTRPALKGSYSDGNTSISYLDTGVQVSNNRGNSEWYYGLAWAFIDISATPLVAGNTYTFSLKAKGTAKQVAARIGIQNKSTDKTMSLVKYIDINNSDWTKVSYTFTIPSDTTNIFLRVQGAVANSYTTGFVGGETFTMKELKLEFGNVATDWSPAPEDVDSAIAKAPKLNGNNMYVGDNTYMGTNTFMDGVSLNGKNVVNGLTDTDWLEIPLAEGRTGRATYKVSFGKVFVHLENVKGITAAGNNDKGKIGTLPVNPTPYYTQHIAQSNGRIIAVAIATSGVIYVSNAMGNTMSETDNYILDTVLV